MPRASAEPQPLRKRVHTLAGQQDCCRCQHTRMQTPAQRGCSHCSRTGEVHDILLNASVSSAQCQPYNPVRMVLQTPMWHPFIGKTFVQAFTELARGISLMDYQGRLVDHFFLRGMGGKPGASRGDGRRARGDNSPCPPRHGGRCLCPERIWGLHSLLPLQLLHDASRASEWADRTCAASIRPAPKLPC